MANKASLQNILQQVLAVGNQDQNFGYPPNIYASHYNITTSYLIDVLAKIYPVHCDVLLPLINVVKIQVKDGHIQLPEEYRNILGAPSISVKKDGSDCSDNNPVVIDTASEFKTAILKSGCKTVPITILDKSQWDYRTTSTYAYPTIDNPIGLYVADRKIKVCPYDLANVEVMFVKKEPVAKYGYLMNPDDTFIFDPATSQEVGWGEAAAEFLFKGVLSLYAAYSRDKELTDYTTVLKQIGLV